MDARGKLAALRAPFHEAAEAGDDGAEAGDVQLVAGGEEEEVEGELFVGGADGAWEGEGVGVEELDEELECGEGGFWKVHLVGRGGFFAGTVDGAIEEG